MTSVDTLLSPSASPVVLMEQTYVLSSTSQIVREADLTVAASSGSLGPDTVCSNATALSRGFQFSSNLAADHSVSVRPLPLNS